MLERELGQYRHTVRMGWRGETVNGCRVEIDDRNAYTVEKYLSDFEAMMRKFEAERIDLCGYSHYGFFTTLFALRNPQRVASLVLIEPALFTDPENLRQRAALAMSGEGIESLELMIDYIAPGLEAPRRRRLAEQIKRDHQSNTAIAAEFLVRAEHAISLEQLATLQPPTLLIGGTQSHAQSMVTRAAAVIPHARVWWVEGADHISLMGETYNKEIAAVINMFIKSAAERQAN